MKIIDNASSMVDFRELETGDVFKAYDDFCFMKVNTFVAHGETYNAVNLDSGYFDSFIETFPVQKVNVTLTLT